MSEWAKVSMGTGFEKVIEIKGRVESGERAPIARYANLDRSHR